MKAWQINDYGKPEVLTLVELPDPIPQQGSVLIQVEAFGINRSELYTRQGHSGDSVTLPRVLGIECVGLVLDAGGTDLEPGMTVAACMGNMGRLYDGGYAEITSVPRSNVFPIETDLPWEVFGAIPETYLTAWGAIHNAIRLQKGSTLLIRGGTSAAGKAAACIAKEMGCTVFSTTRSERKAVGLRNGTVDQVIIDQGEIAEEVKGLTKGRGVDGVIEFVGNEKTIKDCLAATAPQGSVCMVGFLGDTWDYRFFPWMPSTVNLTIYNTETLHTDTATPALQRIADHMSSGAYLPNIDTVFEFDHVVDAHTRMEQNQASGKLVVRINRQA